MAQLRIGRKLWGNDWDSYDLPDKPTGMHWRTFDRWVEKWEQREERDNATMHLMLARLMKPGVL